MMHDKTNRTFRTLTLGASRAVALSTLCGLVSVACAGGDTPPRDRDLELSIRDAYVTGGPVAAAGAGGAGPSGAGGGPAGPPPSGAGGSAAPPPVTGMGGSAPVGAGGGGGDEPCNGLAILQASCGQSSCHGTGSGQSAFAEDEEAVLSFVGESGSATCASEGPLFDPANPEDSIVIQKLDDNPPCGSKMPFGPALSAEDVACLVEWIGSLE